MREEKCFLQQIWHSSNFIWPCWLTKLCCVFLEPKLHKLCLKKKKRSKLNQKHDIHSYRMHSSCAWHEIDLHIFFSSYEKGLLTEPIIPRVWIPKLWVLVTAHSWHQLPPGIPSFLNLWVSIRCTCWDSHSKPQFLEIIHCTLGVAVSIQRDERMLQRMKLWQYHWSVFTVSSSNCHL